MVRADCGLRLGEGTSDLGEVLDLIPGAGCDHWRITPVASRRRRKLLLPLVTAKGLGDRPSQRAEKLVPAQGLRDVAPLLLGDRGEPLRTVLCLRQARALRSRLFARQADRLSEAIGLITGVRMRKRRVGSPKQAVKGG